MASTTKGEAVYAKLHSDAAREALRAIVAGEFDEDLDILVQNAQNRLKFRMRSATPVGSRVRILDLPEAGPYAGKRGEVVRVSQKTITVFLDEDYAEWMGPRHAMTKADKAASASLRLTPGLVEREVKEGSR